MSEHEGITGELRGAMNVDSEYTMGGDVVARTYRMSRDEFTDLCDNIDAVHNNLERENESLRRELDRVTGEMDEHHAWAPESHYVMLPKDSAGEPIHEHDKVDWRDHAGTWHENVTVVAVCNDGCYVMDGIVFHVHKSDIRHHHEPTVEDVLMDLLEESSDPTCDATPTELAEKYAAKLRLAGDA